MVHMVKSWIYLRSRDPYKRGHGYTSWLPRLLQATVKNVTLQRLKKRLQSAYDYKTSPLIADYDSGDRSTMKHEVMGTPTPIMFEGHEFPGPANPEDFCRLLYNSYMDLPPIEKRDHHQVSYKIWD